LCYTENKRKEIEMKKIRFQIYNRFLMWLAELILTDRVTIRRGSQIGMMITLGKEI
jgi:hypothetical protein